MIITPKRTRWAEYMTHVEEMKNELKGIRIEKKLKENFFLGDLDVEGNISVIMHVRD